MACSEESSLCVHPSKRQRGMIPPKPLISVILQLASMSFILRVTFILNQMVSRISLRTRLREFILRVELFLNFLFSTAFGIIEDPSHRYVVESNLKKNSGSCARRVLARVRGLWLASIPSGVHRELAFFILDKHGNQASG